MPALPEKISPPEKTLTMPRGGKNKYTAKQKRQAAHIEASYRKRGNKPARAWRTVNKRTGGGRKSRSPAHAR